MTSIDIKEAPTAQPVHDLIRKRWSARAFADRPLEQKTLETLLEAASWAPSSMNEQPWAYVYAHRIDPTFQRFYDCLLPGNQAWADRAAVLLLSLARRNFTKNGQPNRHALHDVGAANQTLLLQAADLDIYGHQMGGFDREKTVETFGLTDAWEPVCFLALGYLDDPETLEEPFRSRETAPRQRRPVAEFAFAGKLPR